MCITSLRRRNRIFGEISFVGFRDRGMIYRMERRSMTPTLTLTTHREYRRRTRFWREGEMNSMNTL